MRVVHISSLVRTLVYVKHQKTFRLNYAAYNVSVKCIIVVFSILKLGDLCLMSLLSTSQSLIKKQNFLYTLIKTSLSSTHTHRHTQTQTQAYALQIEKITFKVSSEIKSFVFILRKQNDAFGSQSSHISSRNTEHWSSV